MAETSQEEKEQLERLKQLIEMSLGWEHAES